MLWLCRRLGILFLLLDTTARDNVSLLFVDLKT